MKRLMSFLAMALMVLGAWASQPAAKKQIGLATYSVKGIDSDADKAFKEIAKIGYTDIEISNFNQQQGTVFGKKPAEFKAYLESFGLKLVSSHSSAGLDVKDEAGCLQKWEALFKAHKEMGCTYVVFPMNMNWGSSLDEVKANCALMNKIGKLAKDNGIIFLYHNHNVEFTKVSGTDKLIEEVLLENTDPELVNFQMDVYWVMQGLQDPVAWLQKYPDRFKVLHIKDYYVVGKSKKLDFKAIFNQFYKNGYKDFFVEMETETTMDAADEQAAQMMDGTFMRQMAQRAQQGQGNGQRPQGAPSGQRPSGMGGGGQRPSGMGGGAPGGGGMGGPGGGGMSGGAPSGGGMGGPGGGMGGFGGGQSQASPLTTSLKGIKASFSYLNKADFVK